MPRPRSLTCNALRPVHIRSLTLKGFKSFAEPALLTFEHGVTVVVGPNGSGKSNIVDAIAWVLGAQGPRTMRGHKMDDVVFAGTEAKQALGRAEVTLVLDNSQGKLDVDGAEVAITRRLYRSGESEYLLNDKPCRLADLQTLLSDAGVGRSRHVIVVQGHIDHVVSAAPTDRRAIVEEAAGVLNLRRNKEKAERRLAATDVNCERLSDIQRELRRQLRPLKRQAEAAERSVELNSQLRTAELFVAGERLRGWVAEGEAATAKRAEREARQTQLRSSAQGVADELAEVRSQRASLAEADDTALARAASLLERARGQLSVTRERIAANERQRQLILAADVEANYREEVQRLAAEAAQLESELTVVEDERSQLAAQLHELGDDWLDHVRALPFPAEETAQEPAEERATDEDAGREAPDDEKPTRAPSTQAPLIVGAAEAVALRRYVTVESGQLPARALRAIERLLDDLLRGIYVVDGDQHAARQAQATHPQFTFVSRDGDVVGHIAQIVAAAERRAELTQSAARAAERHSQLSDRRVTVVTRRAQLERLLAEHERSATEPIHDRSEALRHALNRLAEWLQQTTTRLKVHHDALAAQSQQRSAELRRIATLETELVETQQETERQLAEVRDQLSAMEVDDATRATKAEALEEQLFATLGATSADALATPAPTLDDGITPTALARSLREEAKRLGPINELALSEYEEISERHDFNAAQLEDVQKSRRELGKLIKSIDAEIAATFDAAFRDVSANFTAVFSQLFPGGIGRLRLTDPDDPLNTGIELEAQPVGKRVKQLSLLSGGERSLTALAYLFAVFLSRPSPFYVLDEVEAALDDVNLTRFLALLDRFRQDAQLIVVSHQQRTMEAADVLYGVSMPPGGSSTVIVDRRRESDELASAATPSTSTGVPA